MDEHQKLIAVQKALKAGVKKREIATQLQMSSGKLNTYIKNNFDIQVKPKKQRKSSVKPTAEQIFAQKEE